jgi:hypothetical protein
MPILDFKELSTAADGSNRDQFEMFAREFLEATGFLTLTGPDRGPDAGRDLIVEEIRTGIGGETRIRWLVSCKHKAHSGNAVTAQDEPDIHDRVRTHGCQGFLGFYSVVPSSGLAAKLNVADLPFEVCVYDPEKIETQLLTSYLALAKRFFPNSFTKWQTEHPKPAELLFNEKPKLNCLYCNSDLLLPQSHGIVVLWTSRDQNGAHNRETTQHVYWCCKGTCDRMLKQRFWRSGYADGWEDIPDLIIPMTYLRWTLGVMNQIRGTMKYSDDAFENMKELLSNLFSLACRDMTEEEKMRIRALSQLPSYLGGWNYN